MAKIALNYDSLRRLGVELTDSSSPTLRCRWCRTSWSPARRGAAWFERAWWKCPKGCVSSLAHARERHREWVTHHAEAEFAEPDIVAIQALKTYDTLLNGQYGDIGEMIASMPISIRIRFEIPSAQVDAVSYPVRAALMAARDRGAPFAEEFWYSIWRSLRDQYGIQQYLEMEAGWDQRRSRNL
jgi:hypothetical protein